MKEKEIASDLNSFLSFKLGEEVFATHVNKVLNILEMVRITKVPKSPEFMKGVINLRGEVLPVIDTRIKFGMTPIETTKNTCIIVLEVLVDDDPLRVGAMVDSVLEVMEIKDNEIKVPPSIGKKGRSAFIQGMTKNKDRFIMVLDMDKIFSTEEIVDLKDMSKENIKEKGKEKVKEVLKEPA